MHKDKDNVPSPYVGLMPFKEEDAPFFYGREKDCLKIIENLRASRLTVLYGPSGVGKSSILNAGVVHKLRKLSLESLEEYGKSEFAVINYSDWSDNSISAFMEKVRKGIAKALDVDDIEPVPKKDSLVEMLKIWTDRFGFELLIILDQFEEYFNYHPEQKETFDNLVAQLPQAINDLGLRAKFLISLREESLATLDYFKPEIPNIFDNMLRLGHIDKESAREAIIKPIKVYNNIYVNKDYEKFDIEDELVEEILHQLTANKDYNEEDTVISTVKNHIETPYLQLVMMRLWKEEVEEQGSRLLRFTTLTNLKGLGNIIQVHLNEMMKKLSSSERNIAARIFVFLVTPSGTKIAYAESDLAKRADIKIASLIPVLETLADKDFRILRLVKPPPNSPDENRYEIFHDTLAKAISKWLDENKEKEKIFRYAQRASIVLLPIFLLITVFALYGNYNAVQESKNAQKAKDLAQERLNIANAASKEAKKQSKLAEERMEEIEKNIKVITDEREKALNSEKKAREARDIAITKEKEAKKQSQIAENAKKVAISEKVRADKLAKKLDEALRNERDKSSELADLNIEFADVNKRLRKQIEKEQKEQKELKENLRTKLTTLLGIIKNPEDAEAFVVNWLKELDGFSNTANNSNNSTSFNPLDSKLWENGTTLKIKFIGGTPAVREKVKEISQEWTKYANLNFEFVNSGDAQIRVAFKEGEGTWSFLGKDAEIRAGDKPTMNFSWLEKTDLNNESVKGIILHEFGHVIGLYHANQNPNANIPWNEKTIFEELSAPPNYWSRQQVFFNVFRKYQPSSRGLDRAFDRNSVMLLFPIPKKWLIGDSFEPIPKVSTKLSESDKRFACKLYPSIKKACL